MVFKVVISENEISYQVEADAANTKKFVGLTIGDEFDGELVDLEGYKLKITGGSDKNGFPMKKDVKGPRRIKSLLSGGLGYKAKADGVRRRKTIRGNTISEDVVQINTIVSQAGSKSLAEIFASEEEE